MKNEERLAQEAADLFGPDPGRDPLAYYAGDPDADLYLASPPAIAAEWRTFVAGLALQGGGELGRVQAQLDRHVEELGIAYRLTGDDRERPWPLSPVPILIGRDEWTRIEQGLIQRAELLERLLRDIYGPQSLVAEGLLPAAAISGSPHFSRRMIGLPPRGGHYLRVIAVDLGREPGGAWRVLADRVRMTVGIGYALENRLALGRATGGLLASINARRQTGFFEALRDGIAAGSARHDPRVALLTPGRFSQSYPEQAHLARHLGFSLVEGRDLVVRDGRLFVRTIAGLKPIDVVWRWINSRSIDPLHFDTGSGIGVPGLLSACKSGQLAVANWMGAGVVDSRAMSAFLPRLCEHLLGEELRLPNAATWWGGTAAGRERLRADLDDLVLGSAFRTSVPLLPQGTTRMGTGLTQEERARLAEAMARRAMDYTAQEILPLSTAPCLSDNRLEPRSFTLRTYIARDASGQWHVLPGGLGRMSEQDDLRTSLMGPGDLSCDVCIVDPDGVEEAPPPPLPGPPAVRRAQGLLPSQAADNLFWFGRYAARCNEIARATRTLVEEAGALPLGQGPRGAGERLAHLLVRWVTIGPGPEAEEAGAVIELAAMALGDEGRSNSIAALDGRLRSLALLLRDRLSADAWRALNRPLPDFAPGSGESMIAAADALIERFAALMRLIADTMSRSDAWRFLDLGHCLERASLVLQAAQELAPAGAEAEDLSALLDLVDAQALYRSRYPAMPFPAPVIDMVLLDPQQPRGLIFAVRRIVQHLEVLPALRPDGRADVPLRLGRQIRARIEGLDAEEITGEVMEELVDLLARLSDAIGRRYFLQEGRPFPRNGGMLLA